MEKKPDQSEWLCYSPACDYETHSNNNVVQSNDKNP